VDRKRDRDAIERLDTHVTSDHDYIVVAAGGGVRLVPRPLPTPIGKTFPLRLDDDPWEHGFVALVDGVVRGFVATALATWNHRLVVWHLYVDRPWRRRGMGRALLEQALADGRARGARVAWLETSSRNGAGIAVWRRWGFGLCGFDESLYVGTPAEGEVAVFLARSLAGPDPG
jgi:ribosomal protein S18 acetylase RimI-like enzyme